MEEKRILLGVTGSVAATLTGKMIRTLSEVGKVRLIFTEKGRYFVDHCLKSQRAYESLLHDGLLTWDDIFTEDHEWPKLYTSGDDIQHIELREWADCLVIAPLTANTLAKLSHGLCDNLLTSVARAWDYNFPMVLAPAMNTKMWFNYPTPAQISEMKMRGCHIVDPVEKDLACGEKGMGAMAPILDIVEVVRDVTSRVGV